ncbi:hypothetical protein DFJ74DRAFT_762579 [Hyaloraphidium curvatum]|nr:hypothetical protein DFJ74DRAFT_762579 [Hyaloraphidium curvatum]
MSQDAIVIREYLPSLDSLVVSQSPVPGEPDAHECLVEVAYSNVAFADILMIQGLYQNKCALPFIPGTGFSGVVLKSGPRALSAGFRPGDRVFGFTIASVLGLQRSVQHGAWQRLMLCPVFYEVDPAKAGPGEVPIPQLFHVPERIPLISAACIPSALGTNYAALVERGRLQKGDVLVVLAAAGGLGLVACQMGKAIGATVVAVASTDEKLEICGRQGGADHLVNYSRDPEWAGAVNDLTRKRGKRWEGADVIYDPVGQTAQAMKCLARNGRYLVIGFTGRGAGGVAGADKGSMPPIPSVQTNRVLLKSNEIVGVNWGSYFQHERERVPAHIPGALALLSRTDFVPPVYEEGGGGARQSASRPARTPFKGLGSVKPAMELLGTGKTWGLVAVEIAGEEAGRVPAPRM